MEEYIVDFEKYSGDFKWDNLLHFPVPTAEYVLNRSGIDVNKRHETSVEANAMLLSICRTAKNYMFRNKFKLDVIGTELRIASDIEMIYKVLEYIMEFVHVFYTSGSYVDLLNNGGIVEIPAINYALFNTGLHADFTNFSFLANNYKGLY